ncbi:MAG TPA: response regulator transcription factor [Chloroflexi bacterium]|nr:response regulator transcription factor [Chloroflexota bacterium]
MAEQVVRTLVVDDEERIRFFLEETLRRVGHVVTQAANGEEALERLRETPFDLAIVDLNLGGRVDGLRVLEAARWRWPGMAVVILTAHGSLESAMDAIREGVDGYLLKPAEPSEVRKAAAEALEKRQALMQKKEKRVLQRGPFFVDLTKHEATLNGKGLDLTPREFRLLVHLMQNSHRVVPPTELVEVVRDYTPDHLHEARQIIKWYIYRLRQKVEPDSSNPKYIVNVRGVGYRFQE